MTDLPARDLRRPGPTPRAMGPGRWGLFLGMCKYHRDLLSFGVLPAFDDHCATRMADTGTESRSGRAG